MKRIWRARTFLALAALFALVFLASLPHRVLYVDDAILGEQAYWLARDGVVRSELFHGLLGYERRMFVFHKLFVPQGALFVRLFGWSAPALKSSSALYFAATALALWLYLRSARDRFSPAARAFALFLFVAHPMAFEHGFTFRPEMMLACAGLVSYALLERGLRGGGARWIAGSAAMAGVACLVHLNGLMFVAAGTLALFVARRWRAACGFVALALAVASLYLVDALRAGELGTLVEQFRGDPALVPSDFAWWAPFDRLLHEPRRLVRRGQDVGMLLFVALALASSWRALWRRERTLVVYALACVVVLGAIGQSKTTKYMLAYLPELALLVAAGLDELAARANAMPRRALAAVALIAAFVICAGTYDARKIAKASRPELRNAAIGELVLGDAPVVLASDGFVFDEIERFPIRSLRRYRLLGERRGRELELAELFELARADGVTHVVLDPRDGYVALRWNPNRLADAAGTLGRVVGEREGAVVVDLR